MYSYTYVSIITHVQLLVCDHNDTNIYDYISVSIITHI
jgi:hypothetical protein